ncbi:MAG: hypothetical protein GY807_21165 [Gammaproteobacteria bacterium]|nr:hypothetical protein [Gammaproteobacteria bacterium]
MIEITLHGSFEARCPVYGLRVVRKRHGVVDTMCRAIIDAGGSPEQQIEVFRDGTKVFENRSLGEWAKWRLTESDANGFNIRKWKANELFGDKS